MNAEVFNISDSEDDSFSKCQKRPQTPTKTANKIEAESILIQKQGAHKGDNDIIPAKNAKNIVVESQAANNIVNVNLPHENQLDLLKTIFTKVIRTEHLQALLVEEQAVLEDFLKMEQTLQYACFKLFMYKKKHYDPSQFFNKIRVNLPVSKIEEYFEELKRIGFVTTNVNAENIDELLRVMAMQEVKKICEKFSIKNTKSKDQMIQSLKMKCETQPTLPFSNKSFKDLLMVEIKKTTLSMMKISEKLYGSFYRLFLMHTYTNSDLIDITHYFRSVFLSNLQFPTYEIDDYRVFSDREHFVNYSAAVALREKAYELSQRLNHEEVLEVCERIFAELQSSNKDVQILHERAPFLRRFTAEGVYVSTLTSFAKQLLPKYPKSVKVWLRYLIERYPNDAKIGRWYLCLVSYYINHHSPKKDCEQALKLLVDVLTAKKQLLDDVILHELYQKGHQILKVSTNKYDAKHRETFLELNPMELSADCVPHVQTDSLFISQGRGQKRMYVEPSSNGDRVYQFVESVALTFYKEKGFERGVHCESAIIQSLFVLYFWDVIYELRVPGAFVSEVQFSPLDAFTKHFYRNRENHIEQRLEEISFIWNDQQVLTFARENYRKYAEKRSLFGCISSNIENESDLLEIVECIGRMVLSDIFKRFVMDLKAYRSGMPDLLVWNYAAKKAKFVEVKGQNDNLSIKQKLWLLELTNAGASVEVCRVHSKGTKRQNIPHSLAEPD